MPAAHVAISHDPKPVRLDKPDLHLKTSGPYCGAGSSLVDAVSNFLPVSVSHG